jgi:predicted Zn-dependent protease
MMLKKITDILNSRQDVKAWTVRHIITDGVQIYAVPEHIEAQRMAGSERYSIDILRETTAPDGSAAVGSGVITILPGDDITGAVEQIALNASLVANPVYSIPESNSLPDVPLVDKALWDDPAASVAGLMDEMRSTAAKDKKVQLTAAECFGEKNTTHIVNSRGLDAQQESTSVMIEYVLQAKKGEIETESMTEMTRRRVEDMQASQEIASQLNITMDLLEAKMPPNRQGAVVLRGHALATFMAGDPQSGNVLRTLASAASKYTKASSWEIGKPVFKGDVKGDPLTLWANRRLPYGQRSNRFDDEGVPAQRVELIKDNVLTAFSASQRYGEYLDIPVTGAFGAPEVPPGKTPASALLEEPYIEVVQFSWFNPNVITGHFATEIRMGYLVENGERTPIKGGQLIGNYLEALADVRWSAETGFFGNYSGPHTARFNNLKLSGEGA